MDPDPVEIPERWSVGEPAAKLAEEEGDARTLMVVLSEVLNAVGEAVRLAVPATGKEDRLGHYEETMTDLANAQHCLEAMRDWFWSVRTSHPGDEPRTGRAAFPGRVRSSPAEATSRCESTEAIRRRPARNGARHPERGRPE